MKVAKSGNYEVSEDSEYSAEFLEPLPAIEEVPEISRFVH